MSEERIDLLRGELQKLGYLSRGVERWFALDPFSSRTFWSELLVLGGKTGTLLSLFATLPPLSIMLLRNAPVSAHDASALALLYAAGGFIAGFALLAISALILRLKPSFAIDSQAALASISLALAAIPVGLLAAWWLAFGSNVHPLELPLGFTLLMLLLLIGTKVFSAALLSFSIHEIRRIPTQTRKTATLPIAAAGVILLSSLIAALYSNEADRGGPRPRQIPIAPPSGRLVLIGVDGLSAEILQSTQALSSQLPYQFAAPVPISGSAAARWASIGTGTSTELHGVRAIEGIRLGESSRILQSVSPLDWILRRAGPFLHITSPEPLPPEVRRRDYLWEILASRGLPVVAINWWATKGSATISESIIDPATVYRAAGRHPRPAELAHAVDQVTINRLQQEMRLRQPILATAYLPGLDVTLNRLELLPSERLALSTRLLSQLEQAIRSAAGEAGEVMVVGLPGDRQGGSMVLATNFQLTRRDISPADVAPTILDHFGFPASEEMDGSSLRPGSRQERIPTFGPRGGERARKGVDQEYYKSLKSLGYVQ